MNNYYLLYKKGYNVTRTKWIDKATATNWFDQLKADTSCEWGQMLSVVASYDAEYDGEEYIVEEFDR